jgi:cell division protease FtsH
MDVIRFLPSREQWRALFHRHAKNAVNRGMGLPPHKDKPSKEQVGAHFGYWLLALIAIMLFQNWWIAHQTVETIPYSQFLQFVQEHKVESVEVAGQTITGKLKQKLPDGRILFSTTSVSPDLADMLRKNGVTFTGVETNGFWSNLLGWLLPTVGFFALWAFFWRRAVGNMGGGLMSIGRSRAKVYVETDVKTTFADVAGNDEAKEELREVIAFLKDPVGYGRLGAHVPKGILLVGPPGTGKTLLARAVAGEAGVPFFSISGSEFVEMFVGVGAARVRDLFAQARAQAPAIIFIDELDALGRARGVFGQGGGLDEKEQTLNQLLVELDGFDPQSGVVLLAATNRPEILDPALLRAGRFDRQVLVDRPDKPAREAILALHLQRVKQAPDVNVPQLAELTPGLTGADLANVVNEAALLATRRGANAVTLADLTEAVERGVAGLSRKSRVLSPEERRTVAYHEMGHALVALSLPGTDPVHKVSIIPRGVGALGYTIQRPTEDKFLMTKEELEARMSVLCGGRAAERLMFGRISTGAADDLQRVTDTARAMVTRYGMIDAIGPVSLEREPRSFLGTPMPEPQQHNYSEATAQAIDQQVHDLVQSAMDRATAILTERRTVLETCAQTLLRQETLDADELATLVGSPAKQAVVAAK